MTLEDFPKKRKIYEPFYRPFLYRFSLAIPVVVVFN
jgi:hypothetical protein